MVAVPIAAVVDAVKVSVLLPRVVEGLKFAFTPFGNPDAVKVTLPLKPFCGMMLMVLGPEELPCVTVNLAGVPESEKFPDAAGQLFTRFAAFTVPMPVAKSQPVFVP